MRGRVRVTVMAGIMALTMLLGLAQNAAAQAFPQTKQPSSQRMEIMGTITTAGQSVTLRGSGAQSGTNVELDMTVSIPGGTAGLGDVTVSIKLVDGVGYIKLPSSGDPASDQWYSIDTAGLGAMIPGGAMLGGGLPGVMPGGMMPGMGDLGSLDPALLSAFTITDEGKETVDGAATTRYRVDVDVQKVFGALGSDLSNSVQYSPDSKLTEYLWIGDNDMYLHKMQLVMNATLTSSGTTSTVAMDLSYRFYDFDVPITITVPANAQPFPLGSLPTGELPPVAAPPSTGAATPAPAPGMPRTGNGNNALPLLPLLPLLLGLIMLASGIVVRRRALVPVVVEWRSSTAQDM